MSWCALFPGQGSQSIGMGKFLFNEFKISKQLFEEASDTLKLDFKKLCFNGDESELAKTENTQPALLLVSTCGDRVLKEILDFKPQVAAGHSIGEYAAIVSAESMSFTDAMRAVRRRGEEMQKAVPMGEGAMAAVMGLNSNQIIDLCRWAESESGLSPIEPANFNAPGQIVISGSAKLIEWVQKNFKKEVLKSDVGRVKFIPLKVSAPFHCSLMQPAEKAMESVLGEIKFNNAKFPIVQNFTAEATHDSTSLRANLISQISGPVRWIECVEKIIDMGTHKAIEIGNGRVLNGLVKKINSEMEVFNLNDLEDLKAIEAKMEKA